MNIFSQFEQCWKMAHKIMTNLNKDLKLQKPIGCLQWLTNNLEMIKSRINVVPICQYMIYLQSSTESFLDILPLQGESHIIQKLNRVVYVCFDFKFFSIFEKAFQI